MRFPRMTTRRWLGLVAATALPLAGIRLAWLRTHYLSRADRHAPPAYLAGPGRYQTLPGGGHMLNEAFFDSEGRITPEAAKALDRMAAYHAAMERKYRQAAMAPWLPVADDPPPPR